MNIRISNYANEHGFASIFNEAANNLATALGGSYDASSGTVYYQVHNSANVITDKNGNVTQGDYFGGVTIFDSFNIGLDGGSPQALQAGFFGNNGFEVTGTLLGLKGLVIDQLDIEWEALRRNSPRSNPTLPSKQRVAYQINRNLKSAGIKVKTSTIKNSVPTVLKNTGRLLGAASGLVTLGEVAYNQEIKASNILDATVTGLSFIPGAGWAIGGTYLLIDIGFRTFTGQGVGANLDSYLSSEYELGSYKF